MGRKKRKVSPEDETASSAGLEADVQDPTANNGLSQDAFSAGAAAATAATTTTAEQPPPVAAAAPALTLSSSTTTATTTATAASKAKATNSNYAMTSHTGEIIQEDIYVSDGSDDDDDYAEVMLMGSRMGIMRRGLHAPQALQQPNRQWTRATDGDMSNDATSGMKPKLTELEALEQMDPAARAARLALEKQRREQEAILEARREENDANVLRSPALFSKRTAFDIRFDQIEEKPWERNLTPGMMPSAEHLAEVCTKSIRVLYSILLLALWVGLRACEKSQKSSHCSTSSNFKTLFLVVLQLRTFRRRLAGVFSATDLDSTRISGRKSSKSSTRSEHCADPAAQKSGQRRPGGHGRSGS